MDKLPWKFAFYSNPAGVARTGGRTRPADAGPPGDATPGALR